jgi:hypothetical protein
LVLSLFQAVLDRGSLPMSTLARSIEGWLDQT